MKIRQNTSWSRQNTSWKIWHPLSLLGMFIRVHNRSSIFWFMSESFFEPYLFNESFDPIYRTAMNESQMGLFGFSSSTNWLNNPVTEVNSLLDGYIVNEYQLKFWTVHYMNQLCVFRALRYNIYIQMYELLIWCCFVLFEVWKLPCFLISISFQISQLVLHWRKKVMIWMKSEYSFS